MIEATQELESTEVNHPEVEKNEDGMVKLTITGIKEDIQVEGLDNKGLAAKYGLPEADIREIRKHPKLKNLRRATKRKVAIRFVLEDDLEDETTNVVESNSGPELLLSDEATDDSNNNTEIED